MPDQDVSVFRTATCDDFRAAWMEHYAQLMSRARTLAINSSQDPEDLLSQATIRVLRYIELDKSINNFVGLMLVSLLHAQIDSRKVLREKIFVDARAPVDDFVEENCMQTAMDAERELIAKETLTNLLAFVETLPLIYRRIFNMRFLDEKDVSEIGNEIGLSEPNVRQKIRQMRLKIRCWEKTGARAVTTSDDLRHLD